MFNWFKPKVGMIVIVNDNCADVYRVNEIVMTELKRSRNALNSSLFQRELEHRMEHDRDFLSHQTTDFLGLTALQQDCTIEELLIVNRR